MFSEVVCYQSKVQLVTLGNFVVSEFVVCLGHMYMYICIYIIE